MPNLVKPIEFLINGAKTLVKELPEGFKYSDGKYFIPNFPNRNVSKDMFEMLLEKELNKLLKVKPDIKTGVSSKIREIKKEIKRKAKTYNSNLDKAILEEAIENGVKVNLGEKELPIFRSFNPQDNAEELVPEIFKYLVMGENGVKHFNNDIMLLFRGTKTTRGLNLEYDPTRYKGNFMSSLGTATRYSQNMPHVYTFRANDKFPTIRELESTKQGLKERYTNNFDASDSGIRLYAIPNSQFEAIPRFSAHGGSYQKFGKPISINNSIHDNIDNIYPEKYGFIIDDLYDGVYNIIKKGTLLNRDHYLNVKDFKYNPRLLRQAEPTHLLDIDGSPIYRIPKGTILNQDTYTLSSDVVLPRLSKNTVGFLSVGGNYGTFDKNLSVIRKNGGKLVKKRKCLK